MTDYRARLRGVREDRDLTQAEVGKILNKSQQGYNHIEAGRAELKIDDLVKLCQFYNLTADYLVGLSDQPQKIKLNEEGAVSPSCETAPFLEEGSYLKYLTAASNMRMLYSPGTFLYRPEPMRSLWPILPKTRPSGDVMPSMAYREPLGLK